MLPVTVHELARRHPNIVAIKESSGNAEQFTALVRDRVREDFTVYSGDDYFYLPALALGAYGCVSVAGHLCSRELRAMADAFDGGDVETAGRLHRDLQALFTALFAHPSPDSGEVGDERVRFPRRRLPAADGRDARTISRPSCAR